MRLGSVIFCIALIVRAATSGPAYAAAGPCQDSFGITIICGGVVPPPTTDPVHRPPAPTGPTVPIVQVPYLTTGADGRSCIGIQSVPDPDGQDGILALEAEQLWLVLVAHYSLCPGTAPPVVSPAAVAASFWNTTILSIPAIGIRPGHAITGLEMFLETNGAVSKRVSIPDTPLGALVIDARGEYTVDWGDGSSDGPFAIEGTAYPDGQIRHVWQAAGTYRVVVTERWRAAWRLGGSSGTLTTLQTSDVLAAFEARQAQAVVTDG